MKVVQTDMGFGLEGYEAHGDRIGAGIGFSAPVGLCSYRRRIG